MIADNNAENIENKGEINEIKIEMNNNNPLPNTENKVNNDYIARDSKVSNSINPVPETTKIKNKVNVTKKEKMNICPISSFASFLRPDATRAQIAHYRHSTTAESVSQINHPLPNEDEIPIIKQEEEFKTNNINITKNSKEENCPELLEKFKNKIPLFISINIKDDSEKEIVKLNNTLKSIENSLFNLLSLTGINSDSILIFLFIENIFEKKNIHYLLPGLSDDQISLEEESRRGLYSLNNLFYDFSRNDSEGRQIRDSLNIICVYKKDMDLVLAQRVFILGFCKELSNHNIEISQKIQQNGENKQINNINNNVNKTFPNFALLLQNGITIDYNSISKMIMSLTYSQQNKYEQENETSSFSDNKNFAAIGQIEITSDNNCKNIYSLAQQFENLQTNSFDNMFNDLSSRNLINSNFCMLKLNKSTINLINNYFNFNAGKENKINSSVNKTNLEEVLNDKSETNLNKLNNLNAMSLPTQDENFHSEFFPHYIINSLTSSDNNTTIYLPDCKATIDNSNLEFSSYMEDYTNKLSANMRMFFPLFYSILSCKNCSFKKTFNSLINIIHIFGIFINFILPGLFMFVIYSIFFETFDDEAKKATFFFTVLYSCLILLTSYYSLISEKIKSVSILFHILHYTFFLFYLFTILCSIAAVNNLRTKRNKDMQEYFFDSGAFAAIIVINFLLGIAILGINYKNYKSSFKAFLYYIPFGLTSYTSVFLVHSIFNIYKEKKYVNHIGDEKYKDKLNLKNSLMVTGFIAAYIFFGYLIFSLDFRFSRASSVLGLAVIFTIYNGIKMSLIIFNYVKYRFFTSKKFNAELSEALIKTYINIRMKNRENKYVTSNNSEDKNGNLVKKDSKNNLYNPNLNSIEKGASGHSNKNLNNSQNKYKTDKYKIEDDEANENLTSENQVVVKITEKETSFEKGNNNYTRVTNGAKLETEDKENKNVNRITSQANQKNVNNNTSPGINYKNENEVNEVVSNEDLDVQIEIDEVAENNNSKI